MRRPLNTGFCRQIVVSNVAPVVAMLAAALLLGQIPTPAEAIGGLVLVVGVLVASLPHGALRQRRRVSTTRRAEPADAASRGHSSGEGAALNAHAARGLGLRG